MYENIPKMRKKFSLFQLKFLIRILEQKWPLHKNIFIFNIHKNLCLLFATNKARNKQNERNINNMLFRSISFQYNRLSFWLLDEKPNVKCQAKYIDSYIFYIRCRFVNISLEKLWKYFFHKTPIFCRIIYLKFQTLPK